MQKLAIRAACQTYVRDTGVAKHFQQAQLDDWLGLAFDRLVADLNEANPDHYQREEIVQTTSAGTFALSGTGATFARPIALVRKQSLSDTTGLRYQLVRPREEAVQQLLRTYTVRGGVLTVYPPEAASFALTYVYLPPPWESVADAASPDFPSQFHRLIALEGAAMAITEGSKRSLPHGLAQILDPVRQRFQAFLSRENEEGPMVVEATDDWGYRW